MLTLQEAIATFGVTVDDHLDRQAEIPVLSGLQFQGDVAIVPAAKRTPATAPVPEEGVPVLRGQAEANTHLLLAVGSVFFTPERRGGMLLGVLTVAQGATAYLAHPEHAYTGIGSGTYELRRQREQADSTTRLVAD